MNKETKKIMREIKFRAWDAKNKTMLEPQDLSQNRKYWTWLGKKDVVLMQYTGRKDENGKEIYEGDIIGGNYISADNSMGILPNGWNFHKDEDRFLVIWDNKRLGWTFDFKKTIPEDVISEFGEDAEAYMCKWKNHARHLLTDEVGEVLGNKHENPELLEENNG